VVEREDGVIELHPELPVPADQVWFWSERWQRMEREADDDIANGRVGEFDDVDDFLADLDAVKYVRTDSFKADYQRLSAAEKGPFRQTVRDVNRGCDEFVRTRDPSVWPASLRVKTVRGAPGVWEMTWSPSGPDRRATWEWAGLAGDEGAQPAIRWRRIGDHLIFKEP